MDWFVWRVLANPKLHGVTLRDLHTSVSFDELATMHDLLDTLESAQAMAEKGIEQINPKRGAQR